MVLPLQGPSTEVAPPLQQRNLCFSGWVRRGIRPDNSKHNWKGSKPCRSVLSHLCTSTCIPEVPQAADNLDEPVQASSSIVVTPVYCCQTWSLPSIVCDSPPSRTPEVIFALNCVPHCTPLQCQKDSECYSRRILPSCRSQHRSQHRFQLSSSSRLSP